ncbi:hypothetical protein TUM20985_48920 [Mycobacterium antarcticum]|nr:hypothetical protein TUM20985_48920 [Mycolicibacterium sp. TUM20985]GLP77553.1 hypothetical protein TUM20983_46630 [Mycolicibacterium sp. TUM20983]GLP82052.1 hypothetical protein TUM20984_34720 [Mycolicibacterium sp. TUM20984]
MQGGATGQTVAMMVIMNAFVSVYVDWAATEHDVRAAIATLPKPVGVSLVAVAATSDTFGCRTAVDLIGSFDEARQGRHIARHYATQLSAALGLPAFALSDLILADNSEW